MTLRVTGTRSGYATVAVDSESAGRVALAGGPTVMGVAAVGEDLTADTGLWTEGNQLQLRVARQRPAGRRIVQRERLPPFRG